MAFKVRGGGGRMGGDVVLELCQTLVHTGTIPGSLPNMPSCL